jgi:CxxC motif-containing protein
MTETKEFTCIRCPLGCQVVATLEDGKIVSITGNTCPRGAEYVTNELTDPRRIVTSLVKVTGGSQPVASVKTASDIPKGKIFECLDALKSVELTAPVRIGDVVIPDVCGTGIDVIATSNIQ